jgi:hypothetical protein
MRQYQNQLPALLAQLRGSSGARGLSGSGIEKSLEFEQVGLAQNDLANMLSQSAIQQGQFLQQGAFQRSQQELSRNQQLFNSLLQSFGPGMQEQQGKLGAIGGAFGLAGKIGAAALTGGASLPFSFGGGGGGGLNASQTAGQNFLSYGQPQGNIFGV